MTLDSTASKVQYTQSGSTTEWPVPFKFLDNDHLIVITSVNDVDTTLVLDTDYTVSGTQVTLLTDGRKIIRVGFIRQ